MISEKYVIFLGSTVAICHAHAHVVSTPHYFCYTFNHTQAQLQAAVTQLLVAFGHDPDVSCT